MANGGTLFLDEICEMDLSLQTKLLRFLQTSMIQPVGATSPKLVDVRIVCATNRDPQEEVRAGRFREDLFYRLHVVPIHLPKLVERGDDVIEIAEKMLRKFAREEGKSFEYLSAEVQQIFNQFGWPGNVRQLLNVLRNVVVLNDGVEVVADMLPREIMSGSMRREPYPVAANSNAYPSQDLADSAASSDSGATGARGLVGRTLADVERELIEATIDHCGGSIPKAAHILDVSASTIYRKREAWAAKNKAS